jgi:hypothetical protein
MIMCIDRWLDSGSKSCHKNVITPKEATSTSLSYTTFTLQNKLNKMQLCGTQFP